MGLRGFHARRGKPRRLTMCRFNRFAITTLLFSGVSAYFVPAAHATLEHAQRTGQTCIVCHTGPNGGELNATGFSFKTNGHTWPVIPTEPLLTLGNGARAVIGFLHVTAAFFWFGTILYVHIILRPRYAEKGLPPAEVRLGAVSMAVVGISGLCLTLARVNGWHTFVDSRWGILLGVKITFYLVMIGTAFFVVKVIGPKLKEGMREAEHPPDGVFAHDVLAAFDGTEERPAFIAYLGKVYDVSNLFRWKDGKHFRHLAGMDLTSALAKAPHGAEKLAGLPMPGVYDEIRKPPKTAPQKAFYFLAYMNLTLVFIVLLVIAFWRWWA